MKAAGFISHYHPSFLLITPLKAFLTQQTLDGMDAYLTSNPTDPSIGRIWRDVNRVCWVVEDPPEYPENPSFKLIHRVPFEVVDAPTIHLIRRLMGVDASSVLVNASPPPEFGGPRTVDETPADQPHEYLVSITLTVPMGALPAAINLIRPVMENFQIVRASGFNLSVQPFVQDDESSAPSEP